MKVLIPIRTVSGLNVRENWRKRARRVKQERNAAYLLFPYGVKLPCTVTLTRLAPRSLDAHDALPASMKGVVDGVADKIGIKDNDSRVSWLYAQRKDKGYAVEIEVSQA